LSLSDLADHLRESHRLLADLDEATVAALAQRAGLRVARTSIFAAEVIAPDVAAEQPEEQPTSAESNAPASTRSHRQPSRSSAQPRPRARRKEHRQQDASISQLNIFSTEGAEDEGGPGAASTHEE
jgi:hypothetical protein